jgi:ParB family chromosome partitioning protein
LRQALGTKVTLHHGKKGGTLIIHYYSDEELNSIIGQIIRENGSQ